MSTHTKGAMRAAKFLDEHGPVTVYRDGEWDLDVEAAAEIIDRETGALDLLAYAEAEQRLTDHLKSCDNCDSRGGDDSLCPQYWSLAKELGDIGAMREAAIAKAGGE